MRVWVVICGVLAMASDGLAVGSMVDDHHLPQGCNRSLGCASVLAEVAELSASIAADTARWGKVIRDADIKLAP